MLATRPDALPTVLAALQQTATASFFCFHIARLGGFGRDFTKQNIDVPVFRLDDGWDLPRNVLNSVGKRARSRRSAGADGYELINWTFEARARTCRRLARRRGRNGEENRQPHKHNLSQARPYNFGSTHFVDTGICSRARLRVLIWKLAAFGKRIKTPIAMSPQAKHESTFGGFCRSYPYRLKQAHPRTIAMQFNGQSTLPKGSQSTRIPHRLAADAQGTLGAPCEATISQDSSAFKQSTSSPLRHAVKRVESILRRRMLYEYARRHRRLRDALLKYDAANAAAVGTFGDLASTRDNLQYARQVASEARHRAWPHLLTYANPPDACSNLPGWQVYAEIPEAALRETLRDIVRGPAQLRSTAPGHHHMRRSGPTVDERRSQALSVSRESYAKSWRRVFEWTYQRCGGLMRLADELQVARSQTSRLDPLAPKEEGLRGRLIRCLDAEDARERILRTLGQ